MYNYLGRYTHRVAISNSRLIEVTDDKVCFATKHGQKTTLSPLEFIRRFLLHVLPKSFVKIRHYGLLASINADTKLVRARELLQQRTQAETIEPGATTSDLSGKTWRERYQELTGHDLTRCPRCEHGTMNSQPIPVETLKAQPERGFLDSS